MVEVQKLQKFLRQRRWLETIHTVFATVWKKRGEDRTTIRFGRIESFSVSAEPIPDLLCNPVLQGSPILFFRWQSWFPDRYLLDRFEKGAYVVEGKTHQEW